MESLQKVDTLFLQSKRFMRMKNYKILMKTIVSYSLNSMYITFIVI